MTRANRRSTVLVAAGVIAVVLATKTWAPSSVQAAQPSGGGCNGTLVVTDIYTLQGDECYAKVEIASRGVLNTSIYTLTITGHGGLECEGTLNIDTGAVSLRGTGTHVVDEVVVGVDKGIVLQTATSSLRIQKTLTLSSDGFVTGMDDDAQIIIKAGKRLTIDTNLTVRGALLVNGLAEIGESNGAFINNGLVYAAWIGTTIINSGVLELGAQTLLDGSAGDWKAAGDGIFCGILRFSKDHTSCGGMDGLSGDFTVEDCAFFDLNADITTTGTFTCLGNGCVDGPGTLTYTCDTDPREAMGCGSCG